MKDPNVNVVPIDMNALQQRMAEAEAERIRVAASPQTFEVTFSVPGHGSITARGTMWLKDDLEHTVTFEDGFGAALADAPNCVALAVAAMQRTSQMAAHLMRARQTIAQLQTDVRKEPNDSVPS